MRSDLRRLAASGEVQVLAAVVVVLPLLARVVAGAVRGPATAAGLGRVLTALAGGGGVTDIGGAAAAAYGLWSRALTAYEPSAVLDAIGVGAYGPTGHTHPPTSIVLGVPLLAVEYTWWLSYWVVLSAVAIAVSLRLMSVPASIAYPVALGICLTAPGGESLVTTYPVSALLIAAAWRFRDREGVSGVALGLFTAERGLGGLLLLEPLLRRRWRTVAVATAVVLGLLALAVIIEPGVIGGFLTGGRAWLAENLARTDLYTPYAVFLRRGWPIWLLVVCVVLWAAWAWVRGSDRYWVLVWVVAALSPLAWHYTSIQLLPLAVVVWRAGHVGRVIAIIAAATTFGLFPLAPIAANLGWTVAVGLFAGALVLTPVGRPPFVPLPGR